MHRYTAISKHPTKDLVRLSHAHVQTFLRFQNSVRRVFGGFLMRPNQEKGLVLVRPSSWAEVSTNCAHGLQTSISSFNTWPSAIFALDIAKSNAFVHIAVIEAFFKRIYGFDLHRYPFDMQSCGVFLLDVIKDAICGRVCMVKILCVKLSLFTGIAYDVTLIWGPTLSPSMYNLLLLYVTTLCRYRRSMITPGK